jgi:hypothetical protein
MATMGNPRKGFRRAKYIEGTFGVMLAESDGIGFAFERSDGLMVDFRISEAEAEEMANRLGMALTWLRKNRENLVPRVTRTIRAVSED